MNFSIKKEELVKYAREYIIEQLSNGFSFEDIKKKLLETGYSEDIIKEAIIYKEEEELNKLKEDNRRLRVEISHLNRDIKNLKVKRDHSNLFLTVVVIIIFCVVAFSFGYIFKDITNKESFDNYIGEKFGDVGDIGINVSNGGGGGSILFGDTDGVDIYGTGLKSCDELNGYLCGNDEICNGDLLDAIEDNCCSIVCETSALGNCMYVNCNSANSNLPCKCGNTIATDEKPWCCVASSEVFSSIQNEDCIFCGGFLTPPGAPY